MSQQEFEQADRDVIAVVENHAHPDAKKAAAKILQGEQMLTMPDRNDSTANAKAAELRRGILLTAIQVLSCVLVAVLFVAALIDSSIVVFLVNVGVLVCGMVAAILVDRAIRAWRKG